MDPTIWRLWEINYSCVHTMVCDTSRTPIGAGTRSYSDCLQNLAVIESLFAHVSFLPNDSQRQAIENLNGPLFLVAGLGSGKTRVLLWRVVNMIVFHGVAPESIFLRESGDGRLLLTAVGGADGKDNTRSL